MYCEYYKVKTLKTKTWFVLGALKAEDNLAFARTLDKVNSILEFFVPKDYEENFLIFINKLKMDGYILEYSKTKNRFEK